ncbi:MAG: DUF115 domain-containing protein [Spirochaetaceae bacterium]|nr:MAG: DUF115 domain-containing protein [Spirochaetaceae bacterium]
MTALQRNLEALAPHHGELARQLAHVAPGRRLRVSLSRSGAPTATLLDKREIALHSRFDPHKEAAGLVAASHATGFCLVLGLGLGYHVLELLAVDSVQAVLVVEYDLALLRSVLEQRDLSRIWHDSRVSLAVDQPPHAVAAAVARSYVPMLHGNLTTVPLRGRVDGDRQRFADAGSAVSQAVEAVGADLSVQRVFGRQWMRNIIINAAEAAPQPQTLPTCSRAIVTAAGPSLEHDIEAIGQRGADQLLIATDTSLPRLLAAGIRPDVVVAIDCQLVSYLHVLGASGQRLILVADAGVNPALPLCFGTTHYVGGSHPLLVYLRARGLPVSFLDTSDGSVTHTAVHLAARLGATHVEVYGADFCYPHGSAYARGSYIHSHLLGKATRRSPYASSLYQFVMERPELHLERIDGRRAYVTTVMRNYRRSFDTLAERVDATIVRTVNGKRIASRRCAGHARTTRTSIPQAHGRQQPAARSASDPLGAYHGALTELPPPRDPLWRYADEISPDQLSLWSTLLPLAAFYSDQQLRAGSAALLDHTLSRALALLERLL